MLLLRLWSARAGGARPRCPQTRLVWRVVRRRLGPWGRASAGAWRASGRSCCACCAASPWSSVAGAWRADLQARAMAGEGRQRPGWRAEGARKRPRERRTGRRHAAHRRAQHGGRAAARQNRASRPFGPQEVAVMAEATSPTTGRRYGVARVCQIWDQPRSSFYAARQPQAGAVAPASASARRGPKPSVGDETLLAAIRADLERSPWTGEGHRKVWASLRAIDGVRVSRKRLLRLMREHALLSPHRARTRSDAPHDRRIVTEAPNVMWATDATQIATVQDGKVWLFGVAEHWNAELLGWHVAKRGTRFEALQAVGMAVRNQFGRVDAGAARGLALRHDHGSNFMSDAFQKQIRSWGIAPSYAFVGEPQTNGVIERLFRTLKAQIVYGRIFQTVDDVRGAVHAFAARYNAEWLIEKNGHRSPDNARAAWHDQPFRRAA